MKIKEFNKKFIAIASIAALVATSFGGVTVKSYATSKIKTILVGTAAVPRPIGYVNAKGEPDGYEAAVLREIDYVLPQYSIKIEKTQFPSIFAGVDSGRYQVGANNITKKPEREAKYLFSNEYYLYNQTVVLVKKGRKDIKALEDLGGKTAPVSGSGGFAQLFFEQYNKDHPDKKINISYTSEDDAKIYQDIATGKYDFTFAEKVMFKPIKDEYKIDLDYVQLPKDQTEKIQDPRAFYIFSKIGDGPAIRDAFDGAIKKLKKSGKLKELSIKYLGADLTK